VGLLEAADKKIGAYSKGMRQRVKLAQAIVHGPELLVLDEPVARLDPMARREFLQSLMAFTAEHRASVILSSHLVSDLERVCDYLIVLAASRVRLAGEIEDLMASHYRLTGARRDAADLPGGLEVIEASHTDRQSTLIVRSTAPIDDPAFTVDGIDLEDLVLAYMSEAAEGGPDRVLEKQR